MRAKRTEAASAASPWTSHNLLLGVMFAPVATPFVWIFYGLNMPWAALISVVLIQSVLLGQKRLAQRSGTKAGLLQSTMQRSASLSRRSSHGVSRQRRRGIWPPA